MKNLTTIKQRILYFIEIEGIGITNFYKESGISYGILSQKSKITEDNIVRFITKYPKINAEWLLTGSGDMFKTECVKTTEHAAKKERKPLDTEDEYTNNNLNKQERFTEDLRKIIEILNEQLAVKDNQINEKDRQIENLIETIKKIQEDLNAGEQYRVAK